MAGYDDLVPKVAIHVSPCPEQAIKDALRHVLRDFCKQSRGWIFDVPAFLPSDDVLSYPLEVPENAVVVHIWGIEGRTGQYKPDTDYYITHPNQLNFNKPPSYKEVKALVSLMPGVNSQDFPDYLMEYFEDYLIAGAVAYLQLQPFRAWSQPNAAEYHQMKYQQGIKEAQRKRDEGLNLSQARRRVRAHYI